MYDVDFIFIVNFRLDDRIHCGRYRKDLKTLNTKKNIQFHYTSIRRAEIKNNLFDNIDG